MKDKPAEESPACFERDVTGDELAGDLDALRAGRYPQWRLTGEARYASSNGTEHSLCDFWRLWLEDRDDSQLVVTLERPRGRSLWRRIGRADAVDQHE